VSESPAPLLAYFGHHKCGTRWLYSIVRHVCAETGLRAVEVHNAAALATDLGAFARAERAGFVAYTNAEWARVATLGAFRGFHVIRDPRDVVVSAYFSHRYSHPTREFPGLEEHRAALERLSEEEGLLAEIRYSAWTLGCMAGWPYSHPDVLELRMEDLVANPYARLLEAFRFLGLVDEAPFGVSSRLRHVLAAAGRALSARTSGRIPPLFPLARVPAERLLGVVLENDFTRKSGGRKPGQEDVRSHYRKGVPGDWRNHFRPAHVVAFKEAYGELLVSLGYEKDLDW
jgi:hypothetical protein